MSHLTTTYRDLVRELDRLRYDFIRYPYLWDDFRVWWPTKRLLESVDEVVTRHERNQLIDSSLEWLDWPSPSRWNSYCDGERVRVDDKGFRVDLNVRQFKPDEIVVKTIDNYVIVRGNQEKRLPGTGLVERHLLRRYLLPYGFKADQVVCDLSSDGILTIKAAPSEPTKRHIPNERLVHIHETGKLALPWK